MRYFIEFAYHGKNYFGYQKQPNAITVQEVLEKALSLILKQNVEIMAAGRTDSGVHAKQMFAHFNTNSKIDHQKTIHKLNSFLPKDIVVFRFIEVPETAHARFDANSRTYKYYIHTFKNAFINEKSVYLKENLNVELMNEAAKLLLNYTDFECFSKVHTDVNTFNCNITEAFWQQNQDQLVFTITADRFLRNMVRAIVGTLINIGTQKITTTDFEKIIESKNRNNAGFSVPAHGLFLEKITYPYLN